MEPFHEAFRKELPPTTIYHFLQYKYCASKITDSYKEDCQHWLFILDYL